MKYPSNRNSNEYDSLARILNGKFFKRKVPLDEALRSDH